MKKIKIICSFCYVALWTLATLFGLDVLNLKGNSTTILYGTIIGYMIANIYEYLFKLLSKKTNNTGA